MTVRQIPLDLPHRPHYAREDYLVAEANAVALATVERFPEQPGGTLALVGPPGCGKTHLAHIWAARQGAAWLDVETVRQSPLADRLPPGGAAVLEAAAALVGERAGEEALFHLLNLARERRAALLLTGRQPPARWGAALPDLRSRLAALPVATIGAPDDALLGAVLVKLFADRQLAVGEGVVAFLLGRMERSLASARELVTAIDRMALAARRPITVPLAAEALKQQSGET